MEILNLIFRLGVLFSIYGFIWFFIDFGLKILVAGRKRNLAEVYLIKAVQYLFLVNVTFLFNIETVYTADGITILKILPSALILLVYFIGKFQQKQKQIQLFGNIGNNLIQESFNVKAEIVLITLSIGMFIGLLYFPQYAENPVANWFLDSIYDIENAVIIGFVFKVIGLFFLVSMLVKMLNAIVYIISGKPFIDIQSSFRNGNKNDKDNFDDFEEVN